MPEPFPFSTTIRVRYNETDAQGHVNFAWYLNYFDVALVEYLRGLGYGYSKMLEEGLDLLYVDSHVAYRSPAYFDEILHIHCRIGKIGNSSIRFDFQVLSDAAERLVATGEITVMMANPIAPKQWTKARVPDQFRQAVKVFENPSTGLI